MSFLLSSLEKALNGYLALDSESKEHLLPLEGKTMTITLTTLNAAFQLSVLHQHIHLTTGETQPAAITLRGTPLNMLCLGLATDKKSRFLEEDIVMEGDAELGQQFVAFFEHIEIDWEEYLALAIGDIPAQEISRLSKGIITRGKQAKDTLLQNINEYIHEEKPWFPPPEAIQDFFQHVDELRMDMDRLEARVKILYD